MPWCPICRTEYREGFNWCSDCETELAEELEVEEERYVNSEDDWALLIQTRDEREAEIIDSLLRSMEIPVLRKDRGAGGYLKVYMGMNLLGTELYVPASQLGTARGIIHVKPAEKEIVEEMEDDNHEDNEGYYNLRKERIWILFFVIPVITALIRWIFSRFSQ